MNLDLKHEMELEAECEYKQMELFHKQQKESKRKYCHEVLNRVCSTCDIGCDDKES